MGDLLAVKLLKRSAATALAIALAFVPARPLGHAARPSAVVAPDAMPSVAVAVVAADATFPTAVAAPDAADATLPVADAALPAAADAGVPAGFPAGGPGFADLFEESDEFDRDSWLGDFDPDAGFGGLGLVPKTGPGTISIDAIGLDGARIEGVAITEGGFRTGDMTRFDGPCVISDLPYGEYLYDVLPPFSYDYVSASMAYHVAGDAAGTTVGARVEIPLADGKPTPITVSGAALYWELTVVLREHMRMKADYYLVSPNNRFYGLQIGPEAPPEYRYDEPPPDAYVPYELVTFEGAPARLAVFMQLPSLRGVSRVELSGVGFGAGFDASAGTDIGTEIGAGFDASAGADFGAGFGADGWEWFAESEPKEYSLTDWSATHPSWQLPGAEALYPDGGGSVGTRFAVFLLPESHDGARFRLDSVRVEFADGGVAVFENPSKSDVTVRIVDVPKRN